MNAKFGGFQTSPKLRLMSGSVVAVIWRLERILLVVVREVGHEVIEVVSQSVHIFIHILKSVVDLPNALVELLELLVRDVAISLLWLVGPRVPRSSLLLLLSFPSRIVSLLFLLLLFLLLIILMRLTLLLRLVLGQDCHHLVLGEDPSVLLHNREGLGACQLDLINLCVIKITKLIC